MLSSEQHSLANEEGEFKKKDISPTKGSYRLDPPKKLAEKEEEFAESPSNQKLKRNISQKNY